VRILPSSLRSRLAVLFALGSALLLFVFTFALYHVLDHQLLSAVDKGLKSRAGDLAVVVTSNKDGQLPDRDPFAQVITLDGRVHDQAPARPEHAVPVLTRAELASVGSTRYFRGDVRELGGDSELLATPVEVNGSRMVLVVGSSIDGYIRARQRLELVLLVASPLLVGLLAGSGWVLAGAALRPVRRLTEEADEITVNELGRRLPVPDSNDEIEHLARTINAMLTRIERAVANERVFIDDASHELRTPISILRGELELALARPYDELEVEASLSSALDEAIRLARLAEDLLALARVRAGELQLRPSSVDLCAASVRLARSLGGEGPAIDVLGTGSAWADPDRVDQIIMNLLSNARRYASHRVEVSVSSIGRTTELVVSDDGPGFAASMLPVTFERFVRADPARGRETGGTGLGLAIVAALARAQGATIEAGNTSPSGGASVRVVFQAARSKKVPVPVRHGQVEPH
jgi:two-component system, OmpR family, sensor kinase